MTRSNDGYVTTITRFVCVVSSQMQQRMVSWDLQRIAFLTQIMAQSAVTGLCA